LRGDAGRPSARENSKEQGVARPAANLAKLMSVKPPEAHKFLKKA
jgi:hypothetical protein